MKKTSKAVVLLATVALALSGCKTTNEQIQEDWMPIDITQITAVSGLSFGVPTDDLRAATTSMNAAENDTININSNFDTGAKAQYILSQPQWYVQTDETTYDYQAYNMEGMLSLTYVDNEETMKNIMNELLDRQDSSVTDFQRVSEGGTTVCFGVVRYIKSGTVTSEQQMYTGGLYLIESNGRQYAVIYGFTEDRYRAELLNQLIDTISLTDEPSSLFAEESMGDPVAVCGGAFQTNPSLGAIYLGDDSFLSGNTTIYASVTTQEGVNNEEDIAKYLQAKGTTIYKSILTDQQGRCWVGKLILNNDQSLEYCYATVVDNTIFMYTAIMEYSVGTDAVRDAMESLVFHTIPVTQQMDPTTETEAPETTEAKEEPISTEEPVTPEPASTVAPAQPSTQPSASQPDDTFILEWN